MSLRTLKRRLKDINLSRKNLNYGINFVRQVIQELLDRPGSSVGYRSIWHTLKLRGIIVPCLVVQELMIQIEFRQEKRIGSEGESTILQAKIVFSMLMVMTN